MKNYIVIRLEIIPAKQGAKEGEVIVNPSMGKEYTTIVEPTAVSTIEFGTKLLKKVREATGMVQLHLAKTEADA